MRRKRRHHRQEGAYGEDGQPQPTRHLERVQRQLEAVLATEPRGRLIIGQHRAGPWRRDALRQIGCHVYTGVRTWCGDVYRPGWGMRDAVTSPTNAACPLRNWPGEGVRIDVKILLLLPILYSSLQSVVSTIRNLFRI